MYKLILLNLVLASTAFACPGLRYGDLNCDEKVDINDFTILAENWLRKYAMSYPDKVRITGGEDLGFAFSEDPMDVAWPQGDFVLTKTADKWLGQLELQGSGGMLIVMEIVLVDGNCLLRSTDNPDDILWGKMGDESITGFYEPITPKTFGIATIIALIEPPVITDITTDNDSLTVSLTGDTGATHTVLYRPSTATAWTTGGTRTGDGNVVIDSLAAGTYYVQAYSTLDGVNSTPGNMVTSTILDNPTQGDDFVSETGITVTVDNDNLVVNITGQSGASHRVLYKTSTESVWKEGGVRKGDGQVTITSLPAATYHVQVKSI